MQLKVEELERQVCEGSKKKQMQDLSTSLLGLSIL